MSAYARVVGVVVILLASMQLRAQRDSSGAAIVGPEFDVVSIKVHGDFADHASVGSTAGAYKAVDVTLVSILMGAYELRTRDTLTGLPEWAEKTHFDIEARLSEEQILALSTLSRSEKRRQRDLMVQGLLAQRFGLKVHHVTKELPAFALTVAKGGPKLKRSVEDPTSGTTESAARMGHLVTGMGTLAGQGVLLGDLAADLAGWVHREVVDRTGLTGRYDLSMKWTPDGMQKPTYKASVDTAEDPPLRTALDEQLGLKLDPIMLATDTVVVDEIHRPSAN